jgi:hypothetical protein
MRSRAALFTDIQEAVDELLEKLPLLQADAPAPIEGLEQLYAAAFMFKQRQGWSE